jgi:hypothetical protein
VFLKNSFYDNATTIGCAASSPYNIGNDKTLLYRYNSRYFTAALGNYYSNYSGSDSNGDGLGDTAYQDATPPPYQFDNTPIMFQETYWFKLKAWMLWAQGSSRRLYQDNSSGWAPPLLFSGSSSQVFSDSTAAQQTWSYCGGDPSDDSTWSGWLTFAAPLDAGHEVSVTLGISDADGANFQARIPTVTITGDGGSSKLEFTAPKGCLVLPAGKRLAVRIENLDSDPFHLMASGAACVLCAPLASHRGAPSVPYSLLLE